ncbi:MAG: hypothetical protein HN700_19910, partial [Verrucomicrobia bacterium]|nr:hypothetical protein [Verrucomicrobiota bacterium]
ADHHVPQVRQFGQHFDHGLAVLVRDQAALADQLLDDHPHRDRRLALGLVLGDLDELAQQAVIRKPGSLPACFRDIPPEDIINMDDTSVNVIGRVGGRVVADAKSTSGLAMKVPRAATPSWAVQAMTGRFGSWGGFGRYHVYAVVRCEIKADKGAAFVGGVWDNRNRVGLGAVSFPVGKPAPPLTAKEIDPNPLVSFATITSGTPVTDGEYHVYDFGVYDFAHADMLVWVGTTAGDMYVERFVFVRAD